MGTGKVPPIMGLDIGKDEDTNYLFDALGVLLEVGLTVGGTVLGAPLGPVGASIGAGLGQKLSAGIQGEQYMPTEVATLMGLVGTKDFSKLGGYDPFRTDDPNTLLGRMFYEGEGQDAMDLDWDFYDGIDKPDEMGMYQPPVARPEYAVTPYIPAPPPGPEPGSIFDPNAGGEGTDMAMLGASGFGGEAPVGMIRQPGAETRTVELTVPEWDNLLDAAKLNYEPPNFPVPQLDLDVNAMGASFSNWDQVAAGRGPRTTTHPLSADYQALQQQILGDMGVTGEFGAAWDESE